MKTRSLPAVIRVICILCVCLATTTPAAVFTSDTIIAADDTTYDGEDIIVTNCTLAINGIHSFASLLIQSNATVTPPGPGAGVNLTVTGDVIVESGGAINVSGQGLPGNIGQGAGGTTGTPASGGGAGHGGYGGLSVSNAPGGTTYGDVMIPIMAGSGGGNGYEGPGGPGGGAIKIIAGALLRIDGHVSANGGAATNSRAGGGSGGSIWLTAQTLAGTGSISVNGGAGEPPYGGGGAGGRIALYFETNDFTGSIQAFGGQGASAGGAGTIYSQAGSLPGRLVLDNAGQSATNTPFAGTSFLAVSVLNGAVLSFPMSPSPNAISNLTVGSNAWVRLSGPSPVNLTVAQCRIEGGGGIIADGHGYAGGAGPGAGRNVTSTNSVSGGGGYGGVGAPSSISGAAGGWCYGSTERPNSWGSGGGNSPANSQFTGGSGGGVITLNVPGTLVVDGRISADGTAGSGSGSGGGAGGSVWLTVGTLSGSGVISASGALGNGFGGGGGGGRIALYCDQNDFTGLVKAYGAGTGTNYGGAGSIYSKAASDPVPQLVFDNANHPGRSSYSTQPPEHVDLTVGPGVTLMPSSLLWLGNLTIGSNAFISLTNYPITVSNNAYIAEGGGISAEGTGSPPGQGQGPGRTMTSVPPGGGLSTTTGGGGGHGGFGSSSSLGAQGGITYGPAETPLIPGSGGGGSGGWGGGVIQLGVSNTLVLLGRITASGQSAPNLHGGGGSGGSISITAGKFEGTGAISSDGGSGNGLGGGGGGGRVVVVCASNTFTGPLTAYGGGTSTNVGGAGSIYIRPDTTSGWATLTIDNGGKRGTNSAMLQWGTGFDLTLRGSAVAAVSSTYTVGRLAIGSNSWLLLSNRINQITVLSNASIETGGGITADGNGFPSGQGPGAGRSWTSTGTASAGGGGHGGYGGMGAYSQAFGGTAYNSTTSPFESGSGGGTSGGTNYGGPGGGTIDLIVNGILSLNGRISAEGRPGGNPNSGGGAGGTVRLTAGSLSGTGLISVNGGAGSGPSGGGAGGRIGIQIRNSDTFAGLLTAYGAGGYTRGGAGTVYRSGTQNQYPTLLVDNGGFRGTNTLVTDSGVWDVTITGGGVLSPSASFSTQWRSLLIGANSFLVSSGSQPINLTGNATIQTGGGLIADGTGNGPGQGPGAGYSTYYPDTPKGGGGYGGYGGANSFNGGRSYGVFLAPTDRGSGGGNGSGSSYAPFGGAGGGSIRLSMSPLSTLTVDGRISANGNPGDFNSGGGSGGSVYITAGTLRGAGFISVNGGAGNGLGGGGGGGRIHIDYRTNILVGPITALGGTGYAAGGAGTVHLRPPNATPLLIVDNAGVNGAITTLGTSSASGIDLTLQNGAALSLMGGLSPRNLVLFPNSWLCFSNQSWLSLNVTRDLIIHPGAGIIADGTGYGSRTGPGAGASLSSPSGTTGGGAGHGGYGTASLTGSYGGVAYGSITNPNTGGSGGGAGYGSSTINLGGAGGGIIAVNVGGTLRNDGRISADGQAAPGQDAGGGAGGSIQLILDTFAGSGVICANGGKGNGLGGAGGGGRIKLSYLTNHYTGLITAAGATGSSGAGGAGTIYFAHPSVPGGQVLVDNASQSGTNTPLALTSPLDVTIRNGAVVFPSSPFLVLSNLLVASGGTLTSLSTQTNLDVTVLGDLLIDTNGQLNVDAKGFAQGAGPGAGLSTNSIGSGAGHGGLGGASSLLEGGATYGSAEYPFERGSGGGFGYGSPLVGSQGGGAIRLNVAGKLTVDGRISADGNAALQDDAGGGSGGSILVTANAFGGNGLITASGGTGELFQGGGGAGGRIAIYAPSNNFVGQVYAAGADGWLQGQNGSIFNSATFDAPIIITHLPTGIVSNAVSYVDLAFNQAPALSSIDYGKLSLLTPSGAVAATGANYSSATALRFTFPLQTTPGDYTLIALRDLLTDIFGQSLSQSYTGAFSIAVPYIQGLITNVNGEPIAGVLVQPSLGSPVLTDNNGFYSLGVPPDTTFTVTPSHSSLVLVPGTRSYTNVTSSLVNEHYLAVTSITPDVSWQSQGTHFLMNWISTPGVSYQWFSSTNLTDWLPYGGVFIGTGSRMEHVLPVGSAPAQFYRLGASN